MVSGEESADCERGDDSGLRLQLPPPRVRLGPNLIRTLMREREAAAARVPMLELVEPAPRPHGAGGATDAALASLGLLGRGAAAPPPHTPAAVHAALPHAALPTGCKEHDYVMDNPAHANSRVMPGPKEPK